ncbi:hypothetical protein V2S66_17680 [Streptomyces sp. V4-01]|uniref:Uncharacterized protein n=1 Tax=Actinacidiphila polyblastidii TaxID=3110430 RepID=A0ABU7PDM9_9ACTN|nr:hypothetical protein [Streptomyces sp. V4-01]
MHTHRLTSLALNHSTSGGSPIMRIVIVVAVVGVALMAWFLLRGYRND